MQAKPEIYEDFDGISWYVFEQPAPTPTPAPTVIRHAMCPECGERMHRGVCDSCSWSDDMDDQTKAHRLEQNEAETDSTDEELTAKTGAVEWPNS